MPCGDAASRAKPRLAEPRFRAGCSGRLPGAWRGDSDVWFLLFLSRLPSGSQHDALLDLIYGMQLDDIKPTLLELEGRK